MGDPEGACFYSRSVFPVSCAGCDVRPIGFIFVLRRFCLRISPIELGRCVVCLRAPSSGDAESSQLVDRGACEFDLRSAAPHDTDPTSVDLNADAVYGTSPLAGRGIPLLREVTPRQSWRVFAGPYRRRVRCPLGYERQSRRAAHGAAPRAIPHVRACPIDCRFRALPPLGPAQLPDDPRARAKLGNLPRQMRRLSSWVSLFVRRRPLFLRDFPRAFPRPP